MIDKWYQKPDMASVATNTKLSSYKARRYLLVSLALLMGLTLIYSSPVVAPPIQMSPVEYTTTSSSASPSKVVLSSNVPSSLRALPIEYTAGGTPHDSSNDDGKDRMKTIILSELTMASTEVTTASPHEEGRTAVEADETARLFANLSDLVDSFVRIDELDFHLNSTRTRRNHCGNGTSNTALSVALFCALQCGSTDDFLSKDLFPNRFNPNTANYPTDVELSSRDRYHYFEHSKHWRWLTPAYMDKRDGMSSQPHDLAQRSYFSAMARRLLLRHLAHSSSSSTSSPNLRSIRNDLHEFLVWTSRQKGLINIDGEGSTLVARLQAILTATVEEHTKANVYDYRSMALADPMICGDAATISSSVSVNSVVVRSQVMTASSIGYLQRDYAYLLAVKKWAAGLRKKTLSKIERKTISQPNDEVSKIESAVQYYTRILEVANDAATKFLHKLTLAKAMMESTDGGITVPTTRTCDWLSFNAEPTPFDNLPTASSNSPKNVAFEKKLQRSLSPSRSLQQQQLHNRKSKTRLAAARIKVTVDGIVEVPDAYQTTPPVLTKITAHSWNKALNGRHFMPLWNLFEQKDGDMAWIFTGALAIRDHLMIPLAGRTFPQDRRFNHSSEVSSHFTDRKVPGMFASKIDSLGFRLPPFVQSAPTTADPDERLRGSFAVVKSKNQLAREIIIKEVEETESVADVEAQPSHFAKTLEAPLERFTLSSKNSSRPQGTVVLPPFLNPKRCFAEPIGDPLAGKKGRRPSVLYVGTSHTRFLFTMNCAFIGGEECDGVAKMNHHFRNRRDDARSDDTMEAPSTAHNVSMKNRDVRKRHYSPSKVAIAYASTIFDLTSQNNGSYMSSFVKMLTRFEGESEETAVAKPDSAMTKADLDFAAEFFTHIIFSPSAWEIILGDIAPLDTARDVAEAILLLRTLFPKAKVIVYNLHYHHAEGKFDRVHPVTHKELLAGPDAGLHCKRPSRVAMYRDGILCGSSEPFLKTFAEEGQFRMPTWYTNVVESERMSPPAPLTTNSGNGYSVNKVDVSQPLLIDFWPQTRDSAARAFIDAAGHHYTDVALEGMLMRILRDYVCPPTVAFVVKDGHHEDDGHTLPNGIGKRILVSDLRWVITTNYSTTSSAADGNNDGRSSSSNTHYVAVQRRPKHLLGPYYERDISVVGNSNSPLIELKYADEVRADQQLTEETVLPFLPLTKQPPMRISAALCRHLYYRFTNESKRSELLKKKEEGTKEPRLKALYDHLPAKPYSREERCSTMHEDYASNAVLDNGEGLAGKATKKEGESTPQNDLMSMSPFDMVEDVREHNRLGPAEYYRIHRRHFT